MSRRYALIEKSRDRNKPQARVIITKKFKRAKEFVSEEPLRREDSIFFGKDLKYLRFVVELPVKFRNPPEWFTKILAMQMFNGSNEITENDALADFCFNTGKTIYANVVI